MIVYADAQFQPIASEILVAIETRLRATDPSSLDDLRTLLIQAGQWRMIASGSHDSHRRCWRS